MEVLFVTLVFNTEPHGNALRNQQPRFKNGIMCAELHSPEFVKLAKCFSIAGHRAQSPAAFAGHL
jgi:hypothetical protein